MEEDHIYAIPDEQELYSDVMVSPYPRSPVTSRPPAVIPSRGYEALQISKAPVIKGVEIEQSPQRSCRWRCFLAFGAAVIMGAAVAGVVTFIITQSPWTSEQNSHGQESEVVHSSSNCRSSPCLNLGDCSDTSDGFHCSCLSGYQGALCETEINECASNPCENGGVCQNKLNGYICECQPGYDGHECQYYINDCASNPCENGGTCLEQLNGFTCECQPGYMGAECETDIDECASSPCENGGTCLEQLNSFTCECQTGYMGAECETDLGDCISNPCGEGRSCHDNSNSYTCSCPDGSSGEKCDTNAALCIEAETIRDPTRSICYRSGVKCDARSNITQGKLYRWLDLVGVQLSGKHVPFNPLSAGLWYRFVGDEDENLEIPEYPPLTGKCDTIAPGWLNASHPSGYEPEENTVCYMYEKNECSWSTQIQIKRCDGFFSYKLYFTTQWYSRICTARIPQRGNKEIECSSDNKSTVITRDQTYSNRTTDHAPMTDVP